MGTWLFEEEPEHGLFGPPPQPWTPGECIVHRPDGALVDDAALGELRRAGELGFEVIEADAPWPEKGGGGRGANTKYAVLEEHEIIEAMLRSPVWAPTPNAHLYLWVTNNHLESGMHVMRALGFRYVTNLVWTKNRAGIGQYFRGRHELVLFGVRSKGRGYEHRSDERGLDTLVGGRVTIHSAKPDEFYEKAERRSTGRRLSMFSRAPREGWWTWGNEVIARP